MRNFLHNFPFANVNNITMLGAAPQPVIGAPNNAMVHETYITQDNPLHLRRSGTYTDSWLYEFSPNALLENALEEMHEMMLDNIPQYSHARVRILYRDRERNVQREAIQNDTLQRYTNLVQRTHTTSFHGNRQFQYAYMAIRDAILFLFESNEEIELEDLHIILDVEGDTGPVGGGRSEITLKNVYAGEDIGPSSRSIEGLFFVPLKCSRLCGWIALAYHFAKYSKPENCHDRFGISADFFKCIPIHGKFNNPKREIKNGTAYIKVLRCDPKVMIQCGSHLKEFFCCARNELFIANEDAAEIVFQAPMLKIVIMSNSITPKAIFKGRDFPTEASTLSTFTVYLHHDAEVNHFHYIDDMKKYVRRFFSFADNAYDGRSWCHHCYRLFPESKLGAHRCVELKCFKCNTFFSSEKDLRQHCKPKDKYKLDALFEDCYNDEDDDLTDLTCPICLVEFYSFECLQFHKTNRKGTQCHHRSRRVKCPLCLKLFSMKLKQHDCTPEKLIQCRNCLVEVMRKDMNAHRCYIKNEEPPEEYNIEEEGSQFYSFDFESLFSRTVTKSIISANGAVKEVEKVIHDVNFVGVQQCFTGENWQFDNLNEFVTWLAERSKQQPPDTPMIMVAHNLKGYDGRLLYDHYVTKLGIPPSNVMWNGTKLMAMTIEGVLFRDSLLHIATSLENMPKIFALPEAVKGFFPYKFNTPANQAYVGTIPPIQYYEPEMMFDKKRKDFLQWYREQQESGVEYNFRNELKKYCISDVEILAKALEVYITEGMKMNAGLNPMASLTIASYAFRVYRTLHMPANTIVALKEEEFNFAQRAMHGGRTDVRQMLKHYSFDNVKQEKYAKYQDVQSLYPYVQFAKNLPAGIPLIHKFDYTNQPSADIVKTWFGFVECDLDIISYIHHPVLVAKGDGKLLADLNNKRHFVTTCIELQHALENGYALKHVYEYHEYEKSTELFKSYLQQYLTVKITNSGIPGYIKTDEDWEAFAKFHEEELGIHLLKEEMCKNAGKKQLAKLMLNSLWGKFAEAKNYCEHKVLQSSLEYQRFETMTDACLIDIKFTTHLPDNKCMVIYKNQTTASFNRNRSFRSNIALAAHVTAWGGLILWSEMNKLGNRVIYHDTDSIVYEYNKNKYNIPEGKYLGEWEDETSGLPIVRFVSTGPKTYAYGYLGKSELPLTEQSIRTLINNKKEYEVDEEAGELYEITYHCKCKGFTLNAYNSKQANFDSLSKLLRKEITAVETKALQFYWDRSTNEMSSGYVLKSMKLTYDKGVIDHSDYSVYPHGYGKFGTIAELKSSMNNAMSTE